MIAPANPIVVMSTKVQEDRHFARITGAALERIVVEAVARVAGIDINVAGVRIERCYISSKMTSVGSCPEAEVLIVVDRQGEPPTGPGYL